MNKVKCQMTDVTPSRTCAPIFLQKFIIVLAIAIAAFAGVRRAEAGNCEVSDDDEEALQTAVKDEKCGEIKIKNTITITGEVTTLNKTFNKWKDSALLWFFGVQKDGKFFCLGCKLNNGGIIVVGTASLLGGEFNQLKGGKLPNGSHVAPIYILNNTLIASNKFTDPQDGGPYIAVAGKGYIDISGNSFKVKKHVVSISDQDAVVMIANNSYEPADSNTVISIRNLFQPKDGTKMAAMETPHLKYLGHDSEYFKVQIDNNFDGTIGKDSYWGKSQDTCPLKAHKRHINFEPYLVESNGVYPIGIYGYEVKEGKWLVKIPITAKADKKSDGIQIDIKDKNINMLVHCEGRGTTRFANSNVKLTYCGDGKIHNGTQCVEIKCRTFTDCRGSDEGKVCVNNQCALCQDNEGYQCPEGMVCGLDGKCRYQCTKDTEAANCKENQICKNQKCVDVECKDDDDCDTGMICDNNNECVPEKPCNTNKDCDFGWRCSGREGDEKKYCFKVECSVDANCSEFEGAYCADRECKPCASAPVMERVCPDEKPAQVDEAGKYYCEGGGEPMCPVNTEWNPYVCSGACICKKSIDPTGTVCMLLPGLVCPKGLVLNTATQQCVAPPPAARPKSGWCTLIRQE